MKRLLYALALALSFNLPTAAPTSAAPNPLTCEGYPEPRVFMESQAWWNKNGIQIPQAVGHHIHLGMCTPIDGQVIDGTLHFDVRIILHDQVGSVTSVRYSDWTTDLVVKSVNFPGAHDATYWTSFDINFSNWSTGRHEIHWRANVPDEQPDVSGAQRMFQSTGWQYCVRSCTPNAGGSDRAALWTEARGWYDDTPTTGPHGYQNSRFRSKVPVAPLSGNWTFSFESRPGADGLATKEWGVFIDPDFHNGNAGITVARGTGESGLRSLTVDTRTLSDGPHRLVIVTSDGKNAGVQSITFKVNNGGTTPTPTPTASATPTSTSTITPTATPTAVPTATPTPIPTSTPTATPSPTPNPTATPTATPTPTITPTPQPTCFPPRAKRCRTP